MRDPDLYRYFLCLKPGEPTLRAIVALGRAIGLDLMAGAIGRLHLTLLVLAETRQRSEGMAGTVGAALAAHRLEGCSIRLGRVQTTSGGAMLRTIGRQPALLALYRSLRRYLEGAGIEPLYARTFEPHITLSYRTLAMAAATLPAIVMPATEIVLVESEVGLSIHNELGRWPLLPPAQGAFDFAPGWPRHPG